MILKALGSLVNKKSYKFIYIYLLQININKILIDKMPSHIKILYQAKTVWEKCNENISSKRTKGTCKVSNC